MQHGKDKTYGMAPKGDQYIGQNSMETAAGTVQEWDGHLIAYWFSVNGVDAAAAVAGMELQVSGFAARTAADPFKRDIFESITDELIVRELQGRNRVEQGFQYVHGFSLAHAKRAWLKCRAWMRRVDGSQGRCELW